MSDKAPIIVKKIKKGGHAAHGGAWKVAYADFVTAMMAFFLLLWLLTATPVENLQGLADYFSPTLGLQGKMGIGFGGGQSPNTEGASSGDWAGQGIVFGAPPSGPIIKLKDVDNKTDVDNIKISFESLSEAIEQSIEEKESVDVEETPEGLRIQIIDKDKRPMFENGTAKLQPHAKKILAKIAYIIKFMPNYVQITGHTSSIDYKIKKNYTNWDLSTDRANATRNYLIKAGIPLNQVAQVIGKENQEPVDTSYPQSPVNDRVTLTLLRKSLLGEQKQAAPDDVLLGVEEEGMEEFIEKKTKKKEAEEEPDDSLDEDSEDLEEGVDTEETTDDSEKKEGSEVQKIMDIIVDKVGSEMGVGSDGAKESHSPEEALDFVVEEKAKQKKETKEERRVRLRKKNKEKDDEMNKNEGFNEKMDPKNAKP